MKTLICLLTVAVGGLILGGCASSPPPPRPIARTEVVVVEDDYDYYPAYEVYYSPATRYYYYRDGRNWVRRYDPPRGWARESASVHVHFRDVPEHHHGEIVRQYPRNWRPNPPPIGSPDRRDRDDDHDRGRGRDRN